MRRPLHSTLALAALASALAAACLAVPAPAHGRRDLEVSIMDDQLLLGAVRGEAQPPDAALQGARGRPAARVRLLARPRPRGQRRATSRAASMPPTPTIPATTGRRSTASCTRPRARAQGDDLDHDPGALWAGRHARGTARTAQAERRPVRRSSRGRSPPATRRRSTTTRSPTSRISPAGCMPQSDSGGLYRPPPLPRDGAAPPTRASRRRTPRALVLIGELASTGRVGRGPGQVDPAARLPARDGLRRPPLPAGPQRPLRATSSRSPQTRSATTPTRCSSPPARRSPARDDAAIGDGRRLLRVARQAHRARCHPARRRRAPDVYYTEFGYQTNPPDPFAGVSLGRQDRYLQQAATSPGGRRGFASSTSSA